MAKEVRCPLCKQNFRLDDFYEIGDSVTCSECYEELNVVSLNPLRVSVSPDSSNDEL